MTCDTAMERLSARLDGALTPSEARELEAHLQSCPQCAALARELEALDRQVANLREEAPEGLKRGILYRIDQSAGKVKSGKRRFWGLGTGVAAAAALLLLVGTGILPLPGQKRATEGRKDAALAPAETAADYENSPVEVAGETGNGTPETNGLPQLATKDAEDDQWSLRAALQSEPEWDFSYSVGSSGAYPWEDSKAMDTEGAWTGESPVAAGVPTEAVQAEVPTENDYYVSGGVSGDSSVQPRPLTDQDRSACQALSQNENALVVLYTEFRPESLLELLETEAPKLYDRLKDLEPEESEGLIRYRTDGATALAVQEWLLQNLPQSEVMDTESQEATMELMLRMEALDPGSGCLETISPWVPRAAPVAWPETWPAEWAIRLRKSENWELFAPEAPDLEGAGYLVFVSES